MPLHSGEAPGGRHAGRHGRGRGGAARRPRGYEGRRGDRDGREPSFRIEEVRTTADGREVPTHGVRHAGRDPRDEHPAPDADERPAGAKAERRVRHRFIRGATGLGCVALALCGAGYLIFGNDGPKTIPQGPGLLEPNGSANASANPHQLTGNALKDQIRNDVQREVNNGENGLTVTVAPGFLTLKTPDGQTVRYVNPIVDLDGLPQSAAATVRTGHFDPTTLSLLDGRVFVTGQAKDTPIQGHEGHNFDRGVIGVDVSHGGATFTPAPGNDHLTEVAVSWETAAPVAIGQGGPLEQNVKTGQFGQHDIGGNWAPMLVGAQVETPGPTS